MSEQLPKSLEYSKYDDEIAKAEKAATDMEGLIYQMQKDIEEFISKIKEIKNDSTYGEEERAEAVADYERMISMVQGTIEIARGNINLTRLLKGVNQIVKERADELLKQGEPTDSLTADIENEDKPSRQVN